MQFRTKYEQDKKRYSGWSAHDRSNVCFTYLTPTRTQYLILRAKNRAREVSHNALIFLIKKHYQNIATLKSDKCTTVKKLPLDVNAKIIRIYELGNENTG